MKDACAFLGDGMARIEVRGERGGVGKTVGGSLQREGGGRVTEWEENEGEKEGVQLREGEIKGARAGGKEGGMEGGGL